MKNHKDHKICCKVGSLDNYFAIKNALGPLKTSKFTEQNYSDCWAIFFKFSGLGEVYFYSRKPTPSAKVVPFNEFLERIKTIANSTKEKSTARPCNY